MAQGPDLRTLARSDGRYDVEALHFIGGSLRHAAKLHGREHATGDSRHLSAQELVAGAADLAAERFGLLGDLVLASWGIRSGDDIGIITFVLIEHGVFSKQSHDRIEDFYGSPPLAETVRLRVRRRLGLDAPAGG